MLGQILIKVCTCIETTAIRNLIVQGLEIFVILMLPTPSTWTNSQIGIIRILQEVQFWSIALLDFDNDSEITNWIF